jgi:hypothetical protein
VLVLELVVLELELVVGIIILTCNGYAGSIISPKVSKR